MSEPVSACGRLSRSSSGFPNGAAVEGSGTVECPTMNMSLQCSAASDSRVLLTESTLGTTSIFRRQ
jgi:hypothetical protein